MKGWPSPDFRILSRSLENSKCIFGRDGGFATSSRWEWLMGCPTSRVVMQWIAPTEG